VRSARAGRIALWAAVALGIASCTPSLRVTWKERLSGALPPDVKTMQVLQFKSQVKHEAGAFTGSAVEDEAYGKTVTTTLTDRIQSSGSHKIIPGEVDLKKFLESRDVMDMLVNEGVMKPEVREKVQKISGADAIMVGEVSCSARKDETHISIPRFGGSLPVKSISATVTVNFRVYSVKTGNSILSDSVTKSKGGLGSQAADQAIMPLITQCVDDFCMKLLGSEVTRNGRMFAGDEEAELRAMIQPLESGVIDPLNISERLEAYAKAHPESAAAIYDLGVLAYIKGDKATADKLIQEAMMKPGAEIKEYSNAYKEMQQAGDGGGREGRRFRRGRN
jgi:curli biogenesis system outer membrane secretion channel CsgG